MSNSLSHHAGSLLDQEEQEGKGEGTPQKKESGMISSKERRDTRPDKIKDNRRRTEWECCGETRCSERYRSEVLVES